MEDTLRGLFWPLQILSTSAQLKCDTLFLINIKKKKEAGGTLLSGFPGYVQIFYAYQKQLNDSCVELTL